MDYMNILFTCIGVFVVFASYKNYDWFMNHRKALFLSKLIGGRERTRIFYIGLGMVIVGVGLFHIMTGTSIS
ncbi:MAG: hypothetical protein HOE80_03620 [Candidatus Magasanikbacteria bacterium]|jgi:hypothetical protein|nr:hypothetical protein [Candidatus Magasanikbacteria bacterium]MBT4071785.1 hypothetical protein [Candidatus Magasanikbacteria bacterium]